LGVASPVLSAAVVFRRHTHTPKKAPLLPQPPVSINFLELKQLLPLADLLFESEQVERLAVWRAGLLLYFTKPPTPSASQKTANAQFVSFPKELYI